MNIIKVKIVFFKSRKQRVEPSKACFLSSFLSNLSIILYPCFAPSFVFYPLIRILSPHPCFIPSSVFYPLIRVLSPHPCFIPSSVFYPLIRIRDPHPYPYPCFIPTHCIALHCIALHCIALYYIAHVPDSQFTILFKSFLGIV